MLDKNFALGACLAASVVICFIAGVTTFRLNETKALTDMVSKGADPQAAACALSNNSTSNNVCMTLATRSINK